MSYNTSEVGDEPRLSHSMKPEAVGAYKYILVSETTRYVTIFLLSILNHL